MKALVLYVDAWPYKLVDVMLRALEGLGAVRHARLVPVYGYTDCFKVTFLSGVYPDEHGYWVSYGFTSNSVPRLVPRSLSPLIDHSLPPVKALRFVLSRFTDIHMFHARTWSHIRQQEINPEASFKEIDLFLRRRGVKTLFEFYESQGLSYQVIEDRFYRHRLDYIVRLVAKEATRNDVVFVYIDEPDFWGHRYGVESPRYRGLLEWLSGIIRYLVRIAVGNRSSFIVFSDHGMADVREVVDIYHYLLRDPQYGSTYVAGIDATFFRVFYLEPSDRDSAVLERVKRVLRDKAVLLDSEARRRYRLPTSRFYGDEVYALREGVVLYPNFFSWLKPRGMHAYSPESDMQHGIVIASEDVDIETGQHVTVPELHTIVKSMVK